MSIGAFARVGGVSVKTLRFYANEGLLSPAHVDPDTGYRFYEETQLEALTRLLNLRAVGMGLDAVQQALNADWQIQIDAREAELRDARTRIDQQLAALTLLREAMAPPHGELNAMRMVLTEPELALVVRRAEAPLAAAFEATERKAAAVKGRAPRPPFTRWYVSSSGEPLVDVCVPVAEAASSELEPEDLDWVGGRSLALSWIHRGSYEQLSEQVFEMKARFLEVGLEVGAETYHIYHRFGADQEGYALPARVLARTSEDYVTELRVPIRPDLEPRKKANP